MSHSFSFLYQGIHKYIRQLLSSFFFFGDLNRPFNGNLSCPFYVDFFKSTLAPLIGVSWRHLTTSLATLNVAWPGDTGGRPLHIL